jgi:serine/threonine-protein kinase MRCK
MLVLVTEIARVGEGKKVYQLEYVIEEQLMVVLSGKQRHVRLIPVRALDGDDVEWIKVAETKGCITFATGVMRRSPQLGYCLCVAIKRQVCSTSNMHGEHICIKCCNACILIGSY